MSVIVAVVAVVITALVGGASSATAGKGPVVPERVQLLSASSCPQGKFCASPVEKPKSPAQVRAAAVPGCNLSENWRVTASAKWDGRDFRYGVLNSPGPLLVGGRPDGTRSEWFTFRGSDRTWDGVYSSRDTSKANYVYRTLGESSLEPFQNVNQVVQIPIAPSGAFCLITINRP